VATQGADAFPGARPVIANKAGRPLPYGDFAAFGREQAAWLDPYAYFRALKDHYEGRPWWEWPAETRAYATAGRRRRSAPNWPPRSKRRYFSQYLFSGQWALVRAAAARRGIEIIGDLPDLRRARQRRRVGGAPPLRDGRSHGHLLAGAGVPPDLLLARRQLWGNPLIVGTSHAADGYAWWLARCAPVFAQVDVVRIDHFFRVSTKYWRIPAEATTAAHRRVAPRSRTRVSPRGPGRLPLGPDSSPRISARSGPSVRALRDQAGLPGMVILQFAFGGKADNLYLPHYHQPTPSSFPVPNDNDNIARLVCHDR